MNKPFYIIGDPKTSNPVNGIAPSPLEGLGHIHCVDILTNPRSVRLNNLLAKQSSTIVTGQIKWQRVDPVTGNIYAIDDSGVVYKRVGSTWSTIGGNSGGTGGGLEIWKNYLITVGTQNLDAYGPLSGSPGWTNNFTGSNLDFSQSQSFSPIFRSVDDALYVGNGRYVSKLAEATTFAPGTGSTFVWTQKAITLAANYQVVTIRDLGSLLMLGTNYLNSNTLADVFPYDRSTLTLGLPIRIVEGGVKAMYNLGNRLYVLAGSTGKLFLTDTTSVALIAQIPNYLINYDGGLGTIMYPDAIMYLKGKIWFGVGGTGTGDSKSGWAGVWSFNPTKNVLQMENIISTGSDGSSNTVLISSLQPDSVDTYTVAWRDVGASSYGVDALNDSLRITSYVGYIDSPLVKVGEALENITFPQLEINLQKPLVSGQGVQIQYRSNLTSSFTTLATVDFATYGGYQSQNIPAGVITNTVYIQIRALLTTGSSNLSPELESILLRLPS